VQYACSSKLKEKDVNHDVRVFSLLLNDCFKFLNAELESKQLTKCAYVKRLMILPQKGRLEIKEAVRTLVLSNFYTRPT
jgi:hypothetical protein